jgi:hypothetical protein
MYQQSNEESMVPRAFPSTRYLSWDFAGLGLGHAAGACRIAFRFKKKLVFFSIIRQSPMRDIAGLWNGCAAKGAASGDAAAPIFLPQLVDFDLNFRSQFLSDFFNFRFKKKLVFFSLI